MTAPQAGRIFISYRRDDSAGYAGRIYDRLAAHFGNDAIFMDVDTIAAGLDFVEVLENAVQSCDVLVALIGRQWLNIKDKAGKQRLENPQDFVRIEVAAALNRSIRVIPVLVDGTPMPNSDQLPSNLESLARRNAVLVNHYSFHNDANRLIEQLELALKAAEESKILKAKELKEKEAQKKHQAEIENLLSQADIAFNLQDWELAKEKLEALLTLEPRHAHAQVKLAIVERKQREIKEEILAEEKAKQEAARKAIKEKAERDAAEKAVKERAEREAAEKAAKEKIEREAAEKTTKEKEERETAEKTVREKAEREAAQKAARERVTHEKEKRKAIVSPRKIPKLVYIGVIGLFFITICIPLSYLGYHQLGAILRTSDTFTDDDLAISSSGWPMENHDAARTGNNSAERTLSPPLELLWDKDLKSLYNFNSQELSVFNSKVALSGSGSNGHQVYMLNASTGDVLWDFTLTGGGGGSMGVTPVFGSNRVFFGGQSDDNLYALYDDTGKVSWQRSGFGSLYASQLATVKDRLYVPSWKYGVLAYQSNSGMPLWQIWERGAGGNTLPTAIRNEMVFGEVNVSDAPNMIVALDINSGAKIWEYSGVETTFSWIVTGSKQVYIKLSENTIVALNMTDGSVNWKRELNVVELGRGGTAALMKDRLYVTVWEYEQGGGGIIAIDIHTGETLWESSVGSTLHIATANEIIYSSGSNILYALSPTDGNIVWSTPIECEWGAHLAIADGKLFAASICHRIYAFANEN